ncbi:HAD family hydrolase [Sulfitobacter aestuarii]|uniref:phosphoglycolate phosphatase n=1 Tax=Sulfitobacter aestuarii TaxID=2161676 RepID=A0ABW5U1E6_9RHOB
MDVTVIRGLLFDKDGTLFDFAATWEAWAVGFLLRAAQGDEAFAARLGAEIGFDLKTRRYARDSVVIAGTPSQVAHALAPHFPQLTQAELIAMLNEEAGRAPQREAVPLVPLLRALRDSGLALGVATNDAEAPARAHLDHAEITGLFDFIAGFDSGHGGKPQPGQMLAFAQAVGLEPGEIAMVGDSLHDLSAGRAAGMRTVAVLTGPALAEELAPLADVVLPDIGHLPGWLAAAQP